MATEKLTNQDVRKTINDVEELKSQLATFDKRLKRLEKLVFDSDMFNIEDEEDE